MELKIKRIKLQAGRPIAFLTEKSAKKLDLHIGDRVQISQNGFKTIASVDISSLVKEKEVAFSEEVFDYINLDIKKIVTISLATEPISTRFIAKKLQGKELLKEEILEIIKDIVNNSLSEAEVAYFVSSVYERGMTFKETVYLTEAMLNTGVKLSWNKDKIGDLHSIGGIAGNRTTPIVVSICAAAGIIMPKTSSRAITSAAGTADVMEVITKVDLNPQELRNVIKKAGASLAWGGSLGLAPADDKIIRVERLLNLDPEAQLLASILSKKLAAGSKYLLIDIPFGPQAKVTKEEAQKLKRKFLKIAKHFNLKIKVFLTLGDQPIGNGIGPVLEIRDVLRVLKQENSPKDLENKSVFLAAKILEMIGMARSGKGEFVARSILETGAALQKFNEIIEAQGKKKIDLTLGKFVYEVKATKAGKLVAINNSLINIIARVLGCPTDKRAGIYVRRHKGDDVKRSDVLLTFYAESYKKLKEAINIYNSSIVLSII